MRPDLPFPLGALRRAAWRSGPAAAIGWAALCLVACGTAAQPAPGAGSTNLRGPPSTTRRAGPPSQGYLKPGEAPDAVRLLGPPPQDGSGGMAGDLKIFHQTRALMGSERWALAARDNALGAAPVMSAFSCALGVMLDPAKAPALHWLLTRAGTDASEAIRVAKDIYKRPRPFVEHGGPICIPEDDRLRSSASYPSGHSTYGWTAALILAQIAPDRAGEILARGRSFGDSRVVCGVHYESDVQAGRIMGSALFSVLQSSPDYRADLAQARSELERLRARPSAAPAPSECAAEADAAARPPW